jgi:putative transcriptional regulator
MSDESLRGQLLVSAGSLFDPNFRQTVVLVGQHSAEGALGVVLNRPSDLVVADVFPSLASAVPDRERLYVGGPVRPESAVLLAELSHPEWADVLIFGSTGFLVGDVSEAARAAIQRARVFAGYAGWGAGQLEAEMAQGSWILDPARLEDVFGDEPESLWSRVLRRKGGRFTRIASIPFDPTTN